MHGPFTRKGYGRIYVLNEEDISKVRAIVRSIDEDEGVSYWPEGLVAHHSEFPQTVYLHKFDGISIDRITAMCWRAGIPCWCYDTGTMEHHDVTATPHTYGN